MTSWLGVGRIFAQVLRTAMIREKGSPRGSLKQVTLFIEDPIFPVVGKEIQVPVKL
jgi:hypothetical protein